jgi:lysozyme family protein
MASFKDAFNIVNQFEYSNKPELFLHKNETEELSTIAGLYRKYNQHNVNWGLIDSLIELCNGDIKQTSKMLYANDTIQKQVISAYKFEYWDKARLDEVNSQLIANNIFVFGVNAGIVRAIKMAQEIVDVTVDGIIGVQTLSALNNYDEALFKMEFDRKEELYYQSIIDSKPEKYAMYENGWTNRLLAV